jgi:hypothetical protein
MGILTTSSWVAFWLWFGPLGAAAVLAASVAVEGKAVHLLWDMTTIMSLAMAVFESVHNAKALAVLAARAALQIKLVPPPEALGLVVHIQG